MEYNKIMYSLGGFASLLLLTIYFIFACKTLSNPVVEVTQGKLKGQTCETYGGQQYFCFKGIPYAKPPVGELRFAIPEPPEPWEGVKDATKTPNICSQFEQRTNSLVGDEDCLYLNVYTPRLPEQGSASLPVMVLIPGGAFLFGDGTDVSHHGPDYLVAKDVVVVSFNYRLGILGFYCLHRKDAPGNMGLRDQVQALKWVQQNIAAFNGDPDNVTIFGISSGGVSVEYQLLSPLAEGLFHKAIAQSGSSLLHWAQNTKIKELCRTVPALAASLGQKAVTDDDEALKFLKSPKVATDDDEALKLLKSPKVATNDDEALKLLKSPKVATDDDEALKLLKSPKVATDDDEALKFLKSPKVATDDDEALKLLKSPKVATDDDEALKLLKSPKVATDDDEALKLLKSPKVATDDDEALKFLKSPKVATDEDEALKLLKSQKVVTDDDEALKFLKSLPMKELLLASMMALNLDKFKGGIHFGFVPTVEQPGDWEPFLVQSSYELLSRGDFNKVPFISGICDREGLIMIPLGSSVLNRLIDNKNFADFLPFPINNTEKPKMENRLKNIYLDTERNNDDADAYAIDFFTDVDYVSGTYVAASLIAKHSSPTYFYEFEYDGNLNCLKKQYNIHRKGACHGDDSGYTLKISGLPDEDQLSDKDKLVRDRLVTMWTNFAKYGNPTPTRDALLPIVWDPIAETGMASLVITDDLKMNHAIYPQRTELYTELYDKHQVTL